MDSNSIMRLQGINLELFTIEEDKEYFGEKNEFETVIVHCSNRNKDRGESLKSRLDDPFECWRSASL